MFPGALRAERIFHSAKKNMTKRPTMTAIARVLKDNFEQFEYVSATDFKVHKVKKASVPTDGLYAIAILVSPAQPQQSNRAPTVNH